MPFQLSTSTLNFDLNIPSIWTCDLNQINLSRFHLSIKNLSAHPSLSTAERFKANRYVSPQLTVRYLLKRILLRQILSHYTGIFPKHIVFEKSQYGRPALNFCALSPPSLHGNFHFNLSDVGGKIIYCFYKNNIGVDLEYLYRKNNFEKLALRFLHPEEYSHFETQNNEMQKRQLFYHYWIRKEAYLKYLAVGLSGGLSSFSVKKLENQFVFCDLHLPWKDYVSCICLKRSPEWSTERQNKLSSQYFDINRQLVEI